MEIVDDIKLYLPQYLSDGEKSRLRQELASFPVNGTKDTVYTSALKDADYLLQGDGIADVQYMNFPDSRISGVPVILMSNTCDMNVGNRRLNESRIMYAPILSYQKYEKALRQRYGNESERVDNFLNDVRNQYVSQILFLPKGALLEYDGIVFFDRALSLPMSKELVDRMCGKRLFTFSNFGFYLFLLKISIHFTRIQEKVNRTIGQN